MKAAARGRALQGLVAGQHASKGQLSSILGRLHDFVLGATRGLCSSTLRPAVLSTQKRSFPTRLHTQDQTARQMIGHLLRTNAHRSAVVDMVAMAQRLKGIPPGCCVVEVSRSEIKNRLDAWTAARPVNSHDHKQRVALMSIPVSTAVGRFAARTNGERGRKRAKDFFPSSFRKTRSARCRAQLGEGISLSEHIVSRPTTSTRIPTFLGTPTQHNPPTYKCTYE